jgi:Beta propeller domain
MTRTRTILSLGAGLLTLAACTADPGSDPEDWPAGEFRLVSFDSCDEAEQELREALSRNIGAWGFGSGMMALEEGGEDVAGDAALAPEAGAARGVAPPAADGQEHSSTNVHEAGVDEPDLVKTDGRRIVTVTGGVLRVVDPAQRAQTGTLDLRPQDQNIADMGWWQPADLLLHGDHALVLLNEGWWGGMPVPELPASDATTGPATPLPVMGPRLLLVDLTGPPRVISEYTMDGSLLDARAVGGTVRVVVRSAPRLSFPQIDEDATEAERTAANREAVESTPVESWLPRFEVTGGGQTAAGQVECAAMSRPETYTGASMLTVLTFDLSASELGDGDPVSVVADGDTVYSNGPSLYIASDQRWQIMQDIFPQPELDERTEIYKFDTSQPGAPRYVGAGAVPGWLVNQYAMSEWEGHLRVATTTGQTWDDGEEEANSESAVHILAERDGELVQTGSVGGLGESERIYAVRFTGPIGYVVTFRETDPLYTLDLRDPAAPAVLGELKIPGYSAYLHPLGDGRLIGVGQEANEEGVTQGTQVSLFDVTDLADPTRLAQHHIEYGSSEAEFDPHAFLWWPDDRLVVIPMTVYDWSRDVEEPPQSTALVLRVEDAGITELGRISQPTAPSWDYPGQIQRSLVIGDTLWTVSDLGLQANSLSTLDQTGWIAFT